ncbi:MAG: hypothetical protein PF440_01110 [Thiomicrorhabdus sp.]|jgi:hypothetical protein|nr:hypothetical protein [Thiomicrorhabdus sp.]
MNIIIARDLLAPHFHEFYSACITHSWLCTETVGDNFTGLEPVIFDDRDEYDIMVDEYLANIDERSMLPNHLN